MNEVTVVDLGMGNLRSVARACERHAARVTIESDPERIRDASRLIVPGQGAFRECAERLADEMGEALRGFINSGKPFFGICLGMQALFSSSEEAPGKAGLGLYGGTVKRFPNDRRGLDGRALKVPHMGWNRIASQHPFFPNGDWFYFVHSFYCDPIDRGLIAAIADYGGDFCAAIAHENVVACQFHPEKSQRAGHELLGRFLGARWS